MNAEVAAAAAVWHAYDVSENADASRALRTTHSQMIVDLVALAPAD